MFSFETLKSQGRLFQLAVVVTVSMSAISDGMHYSWTAPIIPLIQSSNSTIKITEADVLWLENIYMMGGFIGIPLIILTVDRFGRKKSILISVLQGITSWILIASGNSIVYIYVARFFSGVAADVGFVTIPMYATEVADKKIRGFMGSMVYLTMLIGVLVMYSVGPFLPIALSSAVGCAFLLLELCILPFIPESPYYDIMRGNLEAAKTSLKKLRLSEDVDKELEEISSSINKQMNEKRGWTDLFCVRGNQKALTIGILLNVAQHFSGYSVIIMNFHLILTEAGAIFDAKNSAIMYSAVMLISAFLASLVVDKMGRKILICSSCVSTGLSILILALYFLLKTTGVDVSTQNWVPVFSVMFFAFSFKYGLGLVSIIVSAELYPTYVKAAGMTIGDTTYSLSSMLSLYVYQTLKDLYGIHVPFFVFAGCCFLMAVFTAFVIPETKGKTLQEIQLIMNGQAVGKGSKNVENGVNDPE